MDEALKAAQELENGDPNPKYDVNAKYNKLTYVYDMPENDITIDVQVILFFRYFYFGY